MFGAVFPPCRRRFVGTGVVVTVTVRRALNVRTDLKRRDLRAAREVPVGSRGGGSGSRILSEGKHNWII